MAQSLSWAGASSPEMAPKALPEERAKRFPKHVNESRRGREERGERASTLALAVAQNMILTENNKTKSIIQDKT